VHLLLPSPAMIYKWALDEGGAAFSLSFIAVSITIPKACTFSTHIAGT
jgi:hypothetical protein